MQEDNKKAVSKELQRRWVYFILAILFFAALWIDINDEAAVPLHLIDDTAAVAVAALLLAMLASFWKEESFSSLKRQNNVALIAFVIILAFKILAFIIEFHDPADRADELAYLPILVALIANRFI